MEVTWGRTFRIWWAHAWRSYLLLLIPVIPAVVLGVLHPETFQRARPLFDLVMLVWGTLSGIITLRLALQITYSEFRVVLEPQSGKL
jgi:hypothetical protein